MEHAGERREERIGYRGVEIMADVPHAWPAYMLPEHKQGLRDALAKKGGTWDWNNLSQWLNSPKAFAPGTKMTFAGLSNPQDRANVIAFLNAHSDAPKPLPAAPAAAADTAQKDEGKAGTGPNNGPQKAENEPAEDLKKDSSLGAGSHGDAQARLRRAAQA